MRAGSRSTGGYRDRARVRPVPAQRRGGNAIGEAGRVVGVAIMVVSACGVNLALWGLVGALRAASEHLVWGHRPRPPAGPPPGRVTPAEVAVLIPAHDERLVIADTVRAIGRLVPLAQVHVVSDGSRDGTAAIARAEGAHVLEIPVAGGKANALRVGMTELGLLSRYRAVLLLDADTRLDERYLLEALPLFDDPEVAAVAGCASTMWDLRHRSLAARILIAHRERIYFLFQRFMKFGQAWRHVNVVPIVPGFASLYRTSVLDEVRVDAPGLVIEDFNMTFDLHHRRLGRVAFTPRAVAYTQDPDRLADYRRQVRRWTLGFWQTVLRHRMWPSRFSLALALAIVEVLGSVVTLWVAAASVVVLSVGDVASAVGGGPGPLVGPYAFCRSWLDYRTVLVGVVAPDAALTLVTAWCERRPSYLVLGVFFLPLRMLDGAVAVGSLVRAFAVRSTGRWVSPQRRALAPAPAGSGQSR